MPRLAVPLCGFAALLLAWPAAAQIVRSDGAPAQVRPVPPGDAHSIPEPDTIALFLMGTAGLLVGRRLSRRR